MATSSTPESASPNPSVTTSGESAETEGAPAPGAGTAPEAGTPLESTTAPESGSASDTGSTLDITAASDPARPTVVFVTAPQPPKKRGARGVGALSALLGAGLFAAAYGGLILALGLIEPRYGVAGAISTLGTVTFFVPVIVFFLAYLLLVVIVNRAGWWAHVLGGFAVAVVVWVGFVGSAIIAAGAFGAPASDVGAVVMQQLINPLGFAAAIAAREVPIWVGGIVSRRGRTARARNVEARAAYERELAEHRATVAGTTAV